MVDDLLLSDDLDMYDRRMDQAAASGSEDRFFSTQELQSIYHAVFRTSTESPGFFVMDFGSRISGLAGLITNTAVCFTEIAQDPCRS